MTARRASLAVAALVLAAGFIKQAATYDPQAFTLDGVRYLYFFDPRPYVEAVAACATTELLGGPATLIPIERVAPLLVELLISNGSFAEALIGANGAVTAANPPVQQSWDVWSWDAYRACRGVTFVVEAESYFVTTDVPCAWRLCFLCMEAGAAEAMGHSLSTPWYERHLAAAAQPSPYQLGPSASGLQLVQSGWALGMQLTERSRPIVAAYDDADGFWQAGPMVSALYRGGNHNLYALKPLHEDDGIEAWAWVRNQTLIRDFIGIDQPERDGGSRFELYNVIAGAHDYIVSVQGCYDAQVQLERLILFTRTGRTYQLGRGKCTTIFREEAPAGGYLAGLTGLGLNATRWPAGLLPGPAELAYIYQIRLVWAAPAGSAPPRTALQTPYAQPFAYLPAVCPAARSAPVGTRTGNLPGECGSGVVCPSNRCCGGVFLSPVAQIRTCGADVSACQNACIPGSGVCGALPEHPLTLFVRSSLMLLLDEPDEAAGGGTLRINGSSTTVYVANRDEPMAYGDALSYCSTLTALGLVWQLIDAHDMIALTTSLDTRQGGYRAVSGTRLWVTVNQAYADAAPEYACVRGAYSIPRDTDLYAHHFYPSSCLATGGVVCKAAAAQDTTRNADGRTNSSLAGAPRSSWTPGPHTLSRAPSWGIWPLRSSCPYALGAVAPLGPSAAAVLPSPLAAVGVKLTILLSNDSEHVEVVAGLRLSYSNASTSSTPSVVDEALGEWHTLQLAPGEVVTAASGCAGGFLERLVLHTSAGRLWTTPYGRMSLCTAMFQADAPPGGYLVGLQGTFGFYIQEIGLVWGVPPAAPAPAPPLVRAEPSPPSQLPPPPGPPPPPPNPSNASLAASTGAGLAPGAIAGIAVGATAAGAAVLLAAAAGAAAVLRRRRSAASEGARQSGGGGGAAGKGACPADADGAGAAAAAAGGAGGEALGQRATGPPAAAVALVVDSCTSADSSGAADGAVGDKGHSGVPPASTPSQRSQRGPQPPAPDSAGSGSGLLGGVARAASSPLKGGAAGPGQAAARSSSAALTSGTGYGGGSAASSSAGKLARERQAREPEAQGRCMDVVLVPAEPPPHAGSSVEGNSHTGLVPLVLGRDVDIDAASFLGRGSSGVVRCGVLHAPGGGGLPVAVKLLDPVGAARPPAAPAPGAAAAGAAASEAAAAAAAPPPPPASLRMLAQEVHVLSRLDHPNVVRFYGACLDPQQPFLVQELMAMPLSKLIHGRGPLGELLHPYGLVDVLRIARDIAAGLAYLHPTVVHRDLKPGNVLLDAEGRTAKIADFGLARFKQNTHLTTTNVEVGTTSYMPPELFTPNDSKISDRADVYGLGVLLWELATRQRPWVGTRNAVIGYLVAMERQRPPLPAPDHPLCPPPLRSLIERCWAHNPPERPSAAEIVKRLTLLLAEHGGGGAAASRPVSLAAGAGGGGASAGSQAAGGAAAEAAGASRVALMLGSMPSGRRLQHVAAVRAASAAGHPGVSRLGGGGDGGGGGDLGVAGAAARWGEWSPVVSAAGIAAVKSGAAAGSEDSNRAREPA